MGTFNINQIQLGKNLYLIPNANGCNIDLIPVGEASNWECVDDPVIDPDDDTTYVYNNTTNLLYDLYELPNHTTETGTINYVQVFARGKSHTYAQHKDGIYKIIETDDNCANIHKSDDFDLTTTYREYKKVWTTNSRTAVAWTWDDIDDLEIGVECSSPTVQSIKTVILRPDAAGDSTEWHPEGDTPNWECVDEVVANGTTDYNYLSLESWSHDLYNISTNACLVGKTIIDVTVAIVVKLSAYTDPWRVVYIIINPADGGLYYSGWWTVWWNYWSTYSWTWTVNPADGQPWEKADIDDLQIGIRGEMLGGDPRLMITQEYATIKYIDTSINPQIRTTQCYAKVNYDAEVDCTLDKPEVISVDHNQNIKMLNFWSGNRVVYGLARSNRTMVMTGKLYSASACADIECVRLMAVNGSTVNLSGLSSRNYDRAFRILSFGWRKLSEKPLAYDWILELEYE